MKKIGIFYGSTLGNCRKIAEKLQAEFGSENADLINIENANPGIFKEFGNLIFGTSTWGVGEMQEDWENFAHQLAKIDMTGKKVAFFGIGDQVEWADSFVNGMGMLHHQVAKIADVVGYTSMEGYDFEISLAVKDDQFVGLAIDEVNQADLTDQRIRDWVAQLKKDFV
jgi:flavodoxin I